MSHKCRRNNIYLGNIYFVRMLAYFDLEDMAGEKRSNVMDSSENGLSRVFFVFLTAFNNLIL